MSEKTEVERFLVDHVAGPLPTGRARPGPVSLVKQGHLANDRPPPQSGNARARLLAMTAEPYADAAAAEDPQKSSLLALMTKHGARRKGHRHQIIPHHLDLMRVEALEQFDTVKGDLFEFRAPHLGEH